MTRVFLIFPLVLIVGIALVSEFSAKAASRGLLLVANKGDQTLGIIDPDSGKQVAAVPEGGVTGHEVIASPDGRFAYVPIYGNSGVGKPGTDGTNIVAIDLDSRAVVRKLEFGRGVRPHCPLFGPKDGLLYVTTELDNAITVIDPETMKIVGSIPTGKPESHMLAITHDGRYGFTANVGSGTVSVLDMQSRKTLDVISVAPVVQLAVIDTKTRKVSSWIPLPATGYGSAPTPDGNWLVIAVSPANKVAVINLKTMKVEHTIDVPAAPQEVLVRPDGAVAYVSCDASHKVAEIQTSNWAVSRLIDAGPGADGLSWAQQK